jgi:citronellol/citronellal dehydrogenase
VALRTCLDATWNVTRAVVNLAFLGAEPSSSDRPGSGSATRRIVYLAPASAAGEHAGAARAGLENLARTLSIEWARHGITLVTIAPGEATAAGEVAALAAYLASPAGAYFSGCLLDLRGP